MKIKLLLNIFLFCFVVVFSPLAPALDKRTLVADLVFELGYGRAVHNFKDYLLRGDEQYRIKANDYFSSAKQRIDSLRMLNNMGVKELKALDNLEQVIDSYLHALPEIQKAYMDSRALSQVLTEADENIRINDKLAIESIAILREGHRWNKAEKLVFALGYGSAIYNFKNYLIKRDSKYKNWADAWFDEAQQIVAQLKWAARGNPKKLLALTDVGLVLDAYRSVLPVMEKTLEPAKGSTSNIVINIAVRGADKALDIEDGPALASLEFLLASN